MKTIEIGDIVKTVDGEKMVVYIYRATAAKEVVLSCVEADDDPSGADTQPRPMTYRRSEVKPL